jgi:hypothetical protein
MKTPTPPPSARKGESAPSPQASRLDSDTRAEGIGPTNTDSEAKGIQTLQTRLEALQRLKVLRSAKDDFLLYCRLMMPTPDDPDDLSQSMYEAKHHPCPPPRARNEVERGTWPRLIVTMPPRHATQQISKFSRRIHWPRSVSPTIATLTMTMRDIGLTCATRAAKPAP